MEKWDLNIGFLTLGSIELGAPFHHNTLMPIKKTTLGGEESRWRRSSRLRQHRVAGDQLDSLSNHCEHLQIQREIEEKKSNNSRNRESITF